MQKLVIYQERKWKNLLKKEQDYYDNATTCWICFKKFTEEDDKVRDHCHFTGKFRGAAHNSCNLNYKNLILRLWFHNLSGYESHVLVKNLGCIKGNIDCIPNNEEKYTSFTKTIQVGSHTEEVQNKRGETKEKIKRFYHRIRFIDSFKFMATSIDKLVNNLSKYAFSNVRRYYDADKLDLLTRKGIYPYEYADSPKKVKETQLPS